MSDKNFMEYGHDFRQDEPWRIFRIMAEFVEATEQMARVMPAVSIFGSARTHPENPYYDKARKLARKLADGGFNVITGGGPGIMEAANRGVSESERGESIGLNIELPFEQHANPYVGKLISFRYFFIRKVMFLKYSCAVVVFPGGFGTLDEFFESVTLIQTMKMPSRPVYLVGVDFWQGLIDWVKDKMLGQGAISNVDLDIFKLTDDLDMVVREIVKSSACTNGDLPAWEGKAPGAGM